jgi:hypothetical protein
MTRFKAPLADRTAVWQSEYFWAEKHTAHGGPRWLTRVMIIKASNERSSLTSILNNLGFEFLSG